MYKAVIFNPTTMQVMKHYKTMAAAKGAATRLGLTDEAKVEKRLKGGHVSECRVATITEYRELNVDVTVYSLMNGAPCVLRKSDVGGCTDPSTERYWSM